MGLFDKFKKPKWQNENWTVRSDAVKKLDAPKILHDIFQKHNIQSVRDEVASKKITDDDLDYLTL